MEAVNRICCLTKEDVNNEQRCRRIAMHRGSSSGLAEEQPHET